MDHVDWLDLKAAKELSRALAKHVAPGGRVIWRSAALCPPYARLIREAGFEVMFTCCAARGKIQALLRICQRSCISSADAAQALCQYQGIAFC